MENESEPLQEMDTQEVEDTATNMQEMQDSTENENEN